MDSPEGAKDVWPKIGQQPSSAAIPASTRAGIVVRSSPVSSRNTAAEKAEVKGEHTTAARVRDELEQLREELTTVAAESEEARRRRAERREATIARWQGIGDTVQNHARQITPLVLVGAVILGVLVGRRLARK